MPAAEAALVRCKSVVLTNPGDIADTRLEVPVAVAEVPVTHPGETQLEPNARLVWLQCANLSAVGGPNGVCGRAAKILFRMSMMPAGFVGAQS